VVDRTVEVDIVSHDKSAAGLSSAARRYSRFGDEIDRESRRIGDRAGTGIGDRITTSLGSVAKKVGYTAAAIGVKSGARMGEGIATSLSKASPQVTGAVTALAIGAAANAAPLLGAAISGAVVGGAALGGVVGGVILASRDSRVKAAAARIGESIGETLTRQSTVFVGPVLDALGLVDDRFAKMAPVIQRTFTAAARYVVPLTDALLDAGEAIMSGVALAAERAGPVMAALGGGIRTVGDAIADSIALFSTMGPEGAAAFDAIFAVVGGTIRVLAHFVFVLTKAFGWIITLGGLIKDDGAGMEDLSGDVTAVGAATDSAAAAMGNFAGATRDAADAVLYLGRTQMDTGNSAIELDASEVSLATTLDRVTKIREKGNTVTSAERQGLIDLQASIATNITAYAATGATQEQVSAASGRLYQKFLQQAQGMGYTKQAAEALAAQYGLVPTKIDSRVALTGAEAAEAAIREVRDAAREVDRTIDIAIRVTGSSASRSAIAAAIGKQSFMQDAVGSFGRGAAEFAAIRSFAPAPGGRVPRQNISLTNRLRVELDGRAIAPEMYRVVKAVTDEDRWRERTGIR
jgi:hypothetical protein